MTGPRFDPSNQPPREPDSRADSTLPSNELLGDLKAGKIVPINFKAAQTGHTELNQETLDALKEFARRRYNPPPLKTGSNDIHVSTTGYTDETAHGEEWKS